MPQTEIAESPLNAHQLRRVAAQVATDLRRAGEWLGVPLEPIPVRFDLGGTSAGMFCARGSQCWFRFNPWLFASEFERHLTDTVVHEVAHYGIHRTYPRRRLKPHGPEWRALMAGLGANPKASFDADLSAVPVRRQRRHSYVCACRTHSVSTTRHNRIQAGRAEYRCRYCDTTLVLDTSD